MTTLLVAISTLAISKAENNFDLGAPTHLRVENLFPEVAVLSERKPRFSFVPPAAPVGAFNTLQASYRITVSNGKTSVWDSGNVASDATSQIEVREYLVTYTVQMCCMPAPNTTRKTLVLGTATRIIPRTKSNIDYVQLRHNTRRNINDRQP